jgi:hypothetical protein
MEAKTITSDEKVEMLDFVLNNELDRVIPEEIYFSTLLVQNARLSRKSTRKQKTKEEEIKAAKAVKCLDDLTFMKFLGKGGFS